VIEHNVGARIIDGELLDKARHVAETFMFIIIVVVVVVVMFNSN